MQSTASEIKNISREFGRDMGDLLEN